MSGHEIDFIKAALAGDWAVPMGPDCDAFEHELEAFVGQGERVAALVSGYSGIASRTHCLWGEAPAMR